MCHVYINVNVMRREDFFMEKHRKTDDAGVQKRWMIVTDNEGRIVAERLFRKDWIDYHRAWHTELCAGRKPGLSLFMPRAVCVTWGGWCEQEQG